MKKLFSSFCIPFMLINDNVYTFISGILLSLSTGIITTLCLEKTPFLLSWHLYVSSVFYTVVGGMLIYITSQITSYQNYISSKQIVDRNEQKEIINDFESHRSRFWVVFFSLLFFMTLAGTVLLFANYVI